MIEEAEVRRGRLTQLKTADIDPYPARVQRTHTTSEFLLQFSQLDTNQTPVTLVGRLRTIRKHGGLTFAQLEDGHARIQIALKRDVLGEQNYTFFHDHIDMGDFVEVTGTCFVTKKEERTLSVERWSIITKSLLPMPEKWHGLSDIEIRYRQRELDLIANESVRNIFKVRAKIITTMRRYLDEHGFLEVETPILQGAPGGANAEPFTTHHNALDADMYLRVAPELYLKRLVVGGYERVYELARCFRNEGIDHAHNPEFSQIEGYMAYADYTSLMTFLEDMMLEVVRACGHNPADVPFQGHTLNFNTPWPRLKFRDALMEYAGIDIEQYETREELAKIAMKKGVPVEKSQGRGTIMDNIYKHYVRPKIIQPTYIIDHPVELNPLAKRHVDDPRYIERFQLIYGAGVENINAFSELNDPLDQEERFAEQDAARLAGDGEAQYSDQAYLRALMHGMPPTAGWGIGIDRLTATLVDSHNLKEVILFPTLKPEVFE